MPWWLNLHCRRPDSVELRIQADVMPEGASVFGGWPFVRGAVYDALPPKVQPLFRHCASPIPTHHHHHSDPSQAA